MFESIKSTRIPDCLLGKHPLISICPVFENDVLVFTVASIPPVSIVFPGETFAPTIAPAEVKKAEVYNQEPPGVTEAIPGSLNNNLNWDTES